MATKKLKKRAQEMRERGVKVERNGRRLFSLSLSATSWVFIYFFRVPGEECSLAAAIRMRESRRNECRERESHNDEA